MCLAETLCCAYLELSGDLLLIDTEALSRIMIILDALQ
jgi:hypothetical protein